jgi:hypothetical protein
MLATGGGCLMRRSILLALLCAPLVAAAQTYTYLDQSLKSGAPEKTALLIAPDVAVSEISAGGVVEKIPEWGKTAARHVTNALRRIGLGPKLHLSDLPPLSDAEQHALDQHVALYNVVAINVHKNSLSGAELWTKRLQSGLTDYTVGPGLAFLADKTGADTALIVIARDAESSGERKAVIVLGALFGVGMPTGNTFAVAGLIDLRSGRLLWQSYDSSISSDLRVADDADKLVQGLFNSYPAAGEK